MKDFFVGVTIFGSFGTALLGFFTGNVLLLLLAIYQVSIGIFINGVREH